MKLTRINFRLSQVEKLEIEIKAARAGVSVSQYLRASVLESSTKLKRANA